MNKTKLAGLAGVMLVLVLAFGLVFVGCDDGSSSSSTSSGSHNSCGAQGECYAKGIGGGDWESLNCQDDKCVVRIESKRHEADSSYPSTPIDVVCDCK